MNHLSTLKLHRLRLGEIGADDDARARAHLASCEACARRFDAQLETRLAFARAPVPPALAPIVAPEPTPWASLTASLRSFVAPVGLVAAAAAVMLAVLPTSSPDAPPAEVPLDTVRTKGFVPTLEAWVQAGDAPRPVYTGERLRAGTRVQLKVDAGHRRFVTLAGRDGTGAVEVYGTIAAEGPGPKPAPFALTLDDSDGVQTFYAVLTDGRPSPDALRDALAREPVRIERAEVASVAVLKE